MSLLDMLKARVWDVFEFGMQLSNLRANMEESANKSNGGMIVVHCEPQFSNRVATDDIVKELIKLLDSLEEICERERLPHTFDFVGTYRMQYQQYPQAVGKFIWTYSDVWAACGALENSFYNELHRTVYLRISDEREKYYSDSKEPRQLFGQQVETAFPSAIEDIADAGNCLALERWAASAFHCMRVLERGLTALAAKFNVPSDHTNWHNIIEGIESAVRKIDKNWGADYKEQQQFYGDVARHFMFLKDGWRNHVMHIRDKYDEGKALSVFLHTKEFMERISERLAEVQSNATTI